MSSVATLEHSPAIGDVRDEARLSRELEERLAVAAGQRNRIDAELVDLAAEALEGGLCIAFDLPLPRWIAWRLGTEPSQAAAIADIARRHAELPTLIAAMRSGAVSLAQASVIARRAPASHEAEAVRKAEVLRPSQLRRFCHTLPPLESDDEPDRDPPRRSAKRFDLSLRPDDDGDYRLRGLLPADVGAGLDTALRAQLDALWGERRAGAASESSDDRDTTPTLLDALARLTDVAQHAEAEARPHSQRTKTVIHVDLASKVGRFQMGPALPASVRRYLTCDSTFQTVYEAFGQALGVGRTTQQIPARTRLIVEQRDCGCRVPGCGGRYVQIHHVVHWEDGGVTETWNLIALCPQHHRAHHHGRLGISGNNADDPDGITFTDRFGRTLEPRPRPAPPADLPPPPDGAPYRRPEIGNLPPHAFSNPHHLAASPPTPVPVASTRPRLDKDGFPIDFPDEIVLD
jgi:hypothetical protein